MVWVLSILVILYMGLQLYYRYHWRRLSIPANLSAYPNVTLLIPARNEVTHLPALLNDLAQQQYAGEVEVIVLDDHSTDGTDALVKAAQVRFIRLSDFPKPPHQAYKKYALTLGVQAATHDWIVTVDADSRVEKYWLQALMNNASDEVRLVAGPVVMSSKKGLLNAFQQWDMLGMQLFTGGGIHAGHPIMANGANLAFTKKAFEAVQGYEGVMHKSSGDDVFLLQKIKQRFGSHSIRYASDQKALVSTQPASSWSALWQQRIRWASKTTQMSQKATVVLMGTAFIFHTLLLGTFIGSLFNPSWIIYAISVLLLKQVTEFWSLYPLVHRWQLKMPIGWMPVSQLLYLPYVVGVGFLGNFISYQWKGRKTT